MPKFLFVFEKKSIDLSNSLFVKFGHRTLVVYMSAYALCHMSRLDSLFWPPVLITRSTGVFTIRLLFIAFSVILIPLDMLFIIALNAFISSNLPLYPTRV